MCIRDSSLITEIESKDFKTYIKKKNVRIDSLKDLVPDISDKKQWRLVESGSHVFWTQADLKPTKRGDSECNSLANQLATELLEDQLISDINITQLVLSGKHMKINGEKQPSNIWRKYKNIYEKVTEVTLSRNSSMEMEINPAEYRAETFF